MGKLSRNKGAAHERDVCRLIQDAGYKAKRNLDQYQASDGRDVTTDLPLCIQCKCGKAISLPAAWKEAVSACEEHEWPIVWIHYNNPRGLRLVAMSEEQFVRLIQHGVMVTPKPSTVGV